MHTTDGGLTVASTVRWALALLLTTSTVAWVADVTAKTWSPRTWPPLQTSGASLHVTLEPDVFELPDAALKVWIERSAEVLHHYYGRFPVPEAKLTLEAEGGAGVRTGNMKGWGTPRLRVVMGESSTRRHLRRDWVLVHEMVHTAFPDVPDRHNWIEEGLAVYVESVARMRAGDLSREQVWGEFVRNMPKGLPGPNDRGLDRTNTWGNRYWGGAIFCLLADVYLHRESGGKFGLRHALSKMLAAGIDNRTSMPMSEAMATADDMVGSNVMTTLYEARKHRPVQTDLESLWEALGVKVDGRRVEFDDTAKDAWIRRSIESAS